MHATCKPSDRCKKSYLASEESTILSIQYNVVLVIYKGKPRSVELTDKQGPQEKGGEQAFALFYLD